MNYLPEEAVIRQESKINDLPITIETFGEDQLILAWWPDEFPGPIEISLTVDTAQALSVALNEWFVTNGE